MCGSDVEERIMLSRVYSWRAGAWWKPHKVSEPKLGVSTRDLAFGARRVFHKKKVASEH